VQKSDAARTAADPLVPHVITSGRPLQRAEALSNVDVEGADRMGTS